MLLQTLFYRLRPSALFAGSTLTLVACLTGCGGSSSVAENKPAASPSPASASNAAPTEQTPESVVSEFLDGVRRGGSAADVGRLMSAKSRAEYAAAGLVMQPLGAPDAIFEVTRSVPYGDAGVLVNSLWTEKDETGQTTTYQVGWALKKEASGWRVSGLILDDDPEPRVFNFESTEDVLALKQMQESMDEGDDTDPASHTAENPGFSMPPLH